MYIYMHLLIYHNINVTSKRHPNSGVCYLQPSVLWSGRSAVADIDADEGVVVVVHRGLRMGHDPPSCSDDPISHQEKGAMRNG